MHQSSAQIPCVRRRGIQKETQVSPVERNQYGGREGISCGLCYNLLKMRLSKLAGVKKFTIVALIVFLVVKYAGVPIYRTLKRCVLCLFQAYVLIFC